MTSPDATRKVASRRTLLLVLGALAVVIVAAVAWVGVRAVLLKGELESMVPLASELEGAVAARDMDRMSQLVGEVGAHAATADGLSGDPVWRAAELMPGVGANLTAARVVSSHLHSVAAAAQPLVAAMQRRRGRGGAGFDVELLSQLADSPGADGGRAGGSAWRLRATRDGYSSCPSWPQACSASPPRSTSRRRRSRRSHPRCRRCHGSSARTRSGTSWSCSRTARSCAQRVGSPAPSRCFTWTRGRSPSSIRPTRESSPDCRRRSRRSRLRPRRSTATSSHGSSRTPRCRRTSHRPPSSRPPGGPRARMSFPMPWSLWMCPPSPHCLRSRVRSNCPAVRS